jgi:hypothetical protein
MVKVIYDKKVGEWIRLPKYSKQEGSIYLDGFLWKTFIDAKEVMKKRDVDLPIAVTGYPGTGKSTLTTQLASLCDPTFNEYRMAQSAEDFIKGIKEAEPGQAWALDESYADLNSAEIRRETGRALLNVLNIIRQKRLYIFILLPNYFDLAKNIALFRTRWLLHCYAEHFGDVGKVCAFDRNTKHQLYVKGKRFEDYNCVKADFYGTFTKTIPPNFNWENYLKIKAKGLKNVYSKKEDTKKVYLQRNIAVKFMVNELKIEKKKVLEMMDMKKNLLNYILREK